LYHCPAILGQENLMRQRCSDQELAGIQVALEWGGADE